MVRIAVGTDDGDDAWMSTSDAERYLSVTPRTLYRLTDESQLSAYRVGRVIRLQRHDIYELRVDLDDA